VANQQAPKGRKRSYDTDSGERHPFSSEVPGKSRIMTGLHNQPDDAKQIELDRVLDAALAKYAAVEPRAGLEERVLANLRAQPSHSRIHNWWHWSALAAVAAVIVIAVALAWRSGRPAHPVTAGPPSIATPAPNEPGRQFVGNSAENRTQPQGHAPVQTARPHRPAPAVVASAEPKLDQFPSPQPLSEEELALARYAQSFPKEATLIAQAQQEFELEIQKEMNDSGSESRRSGSIQQER